MSRVEEIAQAMYERQAGQMRVPWDDWAQHARNPVTGRVEFSASYWRWLADAAVQAMEQVPVIAAKSAHPTTKGPDGN